MKINFKTTLHEQKELLKKKLNLLQNNLQYFVEKKKDRLEDELKKAEGFLNSQKSEISKILIQMQKKAAEYGIHVSIEPKKTFSKMSALKSEPLKATRAPKVGLKNKVETEAKTKNKTNKKALKKKTTKNSKSFPSLKTASKSTATHKSEESVLQ